MTATLAPHVRPQAGSTTSTRASRATLALATLLVAAPVLRMISIVLHPLDTDDAASTLAHVDEVAARWGLMHLLEPYSTLLLAVAGVVLLRLVPDKGRRVAAVGAVLFALGCSALAMLVHAHGQAYLFMTDDSVDASQMTDLYAVFHDGIPLSAPFIPLFMVGASLLAVGLIQSGRVSRVAAVVFAFSPFIPNAIPQEDSLVLAGIVGSAPMIAAMAVFAVALVRQERVLRGETGSRAASNTAATSAP